LSYLFHTDGIEPFACVQTFTPEECNEIIQIGQNGLENSIVLDGENWRKSQTSWIAPSKEHEWIYKKVSAVSKVVNEKFFQFDLYGFAEDLQFAKYPVEGRYDSHIDCIYHGRIRKLSISVQLSEGYSGGDLMINYGKELAMPRTQGALTAFPSTTLHSVTPVTEGVRYSLVGWITGPRFK
jgi:PKHD-type hydroxylase